MLKFKKNLEITIMAQKRYELLEGKWMQIKDLFLVAKTVRPPIDNRLIFNAIICLVRSGPAWRNPIYFQLSSGNVNDNTVAVKVLSHV